jgi:tRNA A37 threonylcarbamoyladenosine dehydratase
MTSAMQVDAARRFGGMSRLFGVQPAQSVTQSHVVVVGLGGVGSWAAEALARSGVGRLTLIDLDHVAESNINRQIHASDATLGQAKVQAMRERIQGFHPQCEVQCIEEFVTPENWSQLVPPDAHAVIDACDQAPAKTTMAAWALASGRMLVICGAAGGKKQAEQVRVSDLVTVTHDPLLSRLRQELRKRHGAPAGGPAQSKPRPWKLPCVYSVEPVAPPDPSCQVQGGDGSLNCHGYGSLVTVTATFGMCAAGVVLRSLAEQPA